MSCDFTGSVDRLESDSESGTYCARYCTAPSAAVVSFSTSIIDEHPTGLDPLHAAIDADALDRLLLESASTQRGGDRRVSFSYSGYRVTVHSDGLVKAKSIHDDQGQTRHDLL